MKRHILLIAISGALGLLLTGLLLWGLYPDAIRTQAASPAAPQQAPFWEEDFSEALPPGTYYITATAGSGVVDSGSFLLTQNTLSQHGRIFYLTPTTMDEFNAAFRLYLGSNDGGADGAAFIFCPSYDYPTDGGGRLDASCPGGYIVGFDTYDIYDDTVYLAFSNIDEVNRLVTVAVPELENGQWHEAGVILDQGTLKVTLDGNDVIAGFTIPDYEPFSGYFGFSAATGGLSNEQRVDEIFIGPNGYLDGHVYDADTLAPIAGAAVTGERQGGGLWSTETDPSGYYSMTVGMGTYTVTVEHPLYFTDSSTGVEVLTDVVTTVDFYLTAKVAFDPSPLHVTLDWQATHTENALLQNRQPEAYDFVFFEQPGGPHPMVQGKAEYSPPTSQTETEVSAYTGEVSNVPDAASCANALCQEIYGSTASPWGPGGLRDRGNIFEATEDTDIREIRAWLDFVAPTDVYFFIYEGDALTGAFNKIFEVQVMADIGAQWHSSGPINVDAVAGKFYYVGASWNGEAYYWRGTEPVPFLTNCFGILHTGVPGNLAGYPPAPTMNNTWTGFPPYHFAILTGGYFNFVEWFGQDPITGTVPASTTVPGELVASMLFTATYAAGVDQPGDYYATLLVYGDPSLQVPVTMTVLPPVDMGKVEGNVTDNCTAESIEELHVSILGGDPITETWTDENGYYAAWLFEGSYELVFSATGYLPYTDTVDILGGQVTPLDVILLPKRACIDVYPDEFEVWVLTNTLVYTDDYGLDITNNGGEELSFEILEFGELPAMVAANGNMDINSISGSYVALDPSVGGDAAYIPGAEQTFCFRTESYTDDSDDVIALWERFPMDWMVSNVYIQGTPTCDNGGTWNTFGWGGNSPYEIFIYHPRYQAANDHCTAYYCIDVTSGAGGGALVSWYWDGGEMGSPPHNPCSDDGYTPSGFEACDEAVNPQVGIRSTMDIPWLWEDPISGTVTALSSFNVDILFTAVVTEPLPLGTYTATLLVTENDPMTSTPQLPVSMHVVEDFVDPAPAFESNAPLCFGETAVFTNTSVEGVPPTEYYVWDFGDGTTMILTTTDPVTHTYAAAAIYTVMLTAHQVQTGVEVVYTDSIEVRSLPVADFTYTVDGLAVEFTNASANATSYQWDFGDSNTSDLENPTHTYASPGDYLVSLTVYGECGVDQIEKTITASFYHNYLPIVNRE